MENKDAVELVLARLDTMSDNIEVNLGSLGTFQKSDIISHVKDQDEIGKQIVNMQMEYLRSLKSL